MNSFFKKLIRSLSIIAMSALLIMPQQSLGMGRVLEGSLFREAERGALKGVAESLSKDISSAARGALIDVSGMTKTLERGLDESIGRLNTLTKDFKFSTKDITLDEFKGSYTQSFRDELGKLEKIKEGKPLSAEDFQKAHQVAFDESITKRFENSLEKEEAALRKSSAEAADNATKASPKDAEKFKQQAADLEKQANAVKEQRYAVQDTIRDSQLKLASFETALKGRVEPEFVKTRAQSEATMEENAARRKAASDPKSAMAEGSEWEAAKIASNPIKWASNYLLIGLGFSFANWLQARIERTQSHVAEIATACLPQYFGGFWYATPRELINLADPSRSLPVYALVVRQIRPSNFKTEMATSKFTSAGAAEFFYGAPDDETVRNKIDNALFGTDNANDVLDMSNLFVTAGANRGNYCGQLGWGAETMFSPYFGRRMLHLLTGLEFYSTGKAIDPKYPLRQIFGDSSLFQNCDTTIETYVGGEFANMILSGAPATVQYDMFNHNGMMYGTGGKAGIDGDAAKAFVEKYILAPDGKTLLDMPSKIDYISDPALPAIYKTNTTPRQRLMGASAPLGAFNLQQVQEIDATTWQKIFGTSKPENLSLQIPLSGYGYCIYQTADTKYIKEIRKAVQNKSANAPIDSIVDYVVPLMSTGADVAPAIIPVIHGKARGDTTPGWIQWEQNPNIKYLYSLVSGHRYNATTGNQESTTIGSTIESSQLVTGALKDKDTAGDTLLSLQIKAMKNLLSEAFTGKFTWNGFSLERLLTGVNDPYIFRVSTLDANGKPVKTTLPISDGKYLDDFVVPVNLNLEAVDFSSADLRYFVSLVTSKIYDTQLAEVAEEVKFAFARTEESTSSSSSLFGSTDKQTPKEVVFWSDQSIDAKTLSGYKVLTQGNTALGTLFTEWNLNPYNQDKLSTGYIYAALRTSFADAFRTASSDPSKSFLGSLKATKNKDFITHVVDAFAVRILNAMRTTGLTISNINSVIQKPADTDTSTLEKEKKYREAATALVKDFAKTLADTLVSKIMPILNDFELTNKTIKDDNARAYLQNLVGKGNPVNWTTVWQAAIKAQTEDKQATDSQKAPLDFNRLMLALFESIDDATWNNALNNLTAYTSKEGSHWIANPDPKVVERFNKIGDELTTTGIYDFYASIADQGLLGIPGMYLYNNQQQLAKTASNDSPTGALSETIKWPEKLVLPAPDYNPVIASYNAYNKYLTNSNAGIVSLVGPFAFSQKQIPNVLITAIDDTHPVYTSSDYPGDYLIVTDNPSTLKTAEAFNILKPQAYLVSLFTGNIYQRDDTTGSSTQGVVTQTLQDDKITPKRISQSDLSKIISRLSLPANVLAQLNPKTKQGNWVTYAGRRLYLDPRDDQSGMYVYQDITNVPNIAAWETARKTNEFTGVTDFLIGFTKVGQSGDTASVAYGVPLSSTPDLISLVTQATYTSTGAAGTLEAQQDPLNALDKLGDKNRVENIKKQIAKLRGKSKEEKTEKAKQAEVTQEKPLGAVSQLTGAPQFPNSPFSSLYQPSGSNKFYLVTKTDDTVDGFIDFSFTSAAGTCGIGYYDSTGAFISALFGEDAKNTRATQGLFGPDCGPLTLGVPAVIPAITFANDIASVDKEAQLQVGIKPGNLKFTYDGLYPGTYKFYQFTYPIRANTKSKDVAIGLGVLAQYTPKGGSKPYYIEMSSGNVFTTTPFKTEPISRRIREFTGGKWVEKMVQQQVGSYQPEVAHYPILTATQDKNASIVSVSYDASSYPRIFAQGIDGYYYQATYDKDNNDGASLNTVVPPTSKEAVDAYRFYNGAQAFNVSVEGEPHYFNAFTSKMSLQAFTASDGSSMAGKTVDDLNTDTVSKSAVSSYAYNGTEGMRQYKYLGSTKVSTFGTVPPEFNIKFAENAHGQLFQLDTGLFVKGKRNQFENPSMIFVPAVMTDMSTTSTANATGFMACVPDTNKVYTPIAPADATDAAFKAQFKIYNMLQPQNNRHYYVVVCQANDQIEAHYYMPMYEVLDTITRNAVQDVIGMYAITTSSGDNLLVKAINTATADWRPIKYIFGVPAELESSMQTYVQRQAFFNEREGSSSYDEKTGIIKPDAKFINRYFYNLSLDDLSDKKPFYFVGQPVAQFVDLYSGVLFASRSEQDTTLIPVGYLTRANLEALLTAKGVRPPDPFEDPSLYRPMSESVFNPETQKTEERYVESAVGAAGRVTIPKDGLPKDSTFMYCVPSAITTPTDSGSSSSSSSSSSSGFSWENIQEPSSSTTA